jgi:proteic killer suppression protein
MIISIKHKGLKRLFEKGDRSKINANVVGKVELALSDLNAAETIEDLDVPGYRLHQLKGDLRDYYSIWVTGNWRIVFKFENSEASHIDFVDYH